MKTTVMTMTTIVMERLYHHEKEMQEPDDFDIELEDDEMGDNINR